MLNLDVLVLSLSVPTTNLRSEGFEFMNDVLRQPEDENNKEAT